MTQAWNFAGIQSGVSELQRSVTTIHQLLDDGKSSLSRLSAVWGGSGSESFQAVQQRWDATSQEVNSALQSLAHAIGESGQAMQQTEQGVAGMFGA
jgi:6 kDa early secretory antigenic target